MNIALVTFLKDEARYLIEHYLWYKSIGVGTFYYVHNSCTDDSETVLEFLSEKDSAVKVIDNVVKEGDRPQITGARKVYPEIQRRGDIDYVLCVDMDEFLVLKGHTSIEELIKSCSCPDVISFNWANFGSSGQVSESNSPVIERFTKRSIDNFPSNRIMKSLWKVSSGVRGFGPHKPIFRKNVDLESLSWVIPCANEPVKVAMGFRNGTVSKHSGEPCLNLAQLNHYAVKSHEEYKKRRERGRGHSGKNVSVNKVRHDDKYFESMDRNEIIDTAASDYFYGLKDNYNTLSSEYDKYSGSNTLDHEFDLEKLPKTLNYVGEFGAEMVLFLPFCYWLSHKGLLKNRVISTYRGMSCFYRDLGCKDIIEKDIPRKFVGFKKRPNWLPVKCEHDFDGKSMPSRFIYPDLRSSFSKHAHLLKPVLPKNNKPLLIIHNKFNVEWGKKPFNYIGLNNLKKLFARLVSHFNVVYIRHGMSDEDKTFSSDHNAPVEFNDRSIVENFPRVLDFEKLYGKFSNLSGIEDINFFKNILYSQCYRFITTQGGGAHHIAMFSGANIAVLHRKGRETEWAYDQGYYRYMSNPSPRLTVCRTQKALLTTVDHFIESKRDEPNYEIDTGFNKNQGHLKYWLQGEPYQNFGDFLSEFLLSKIACETESFENQSIRIVGSIVAPRVIRKDLSDLSSETKLYYWGCGARESSLLPKPLLKRLSICSVRGSLSAKVIRNERAVIGDTALLLPLIYRPKKLNEFENANVLFTHYHESRGDDELKRLTGVDYVVRTKTDNKITSVLSLIDIIYSSKFVLTSSLHGAIISTAYKIPFCYWDDGNTNYPFKWDDFSSSIGIDTYFASNLVDGIEYYKRVHSNIVLPQLLPMLHAAPFSVREELIMAAKRYDAKF